MTVEPPNTPAASPPAGTPPGAAAAIDLTGGAETPVATAGRVIGGLLTLIIGGLIAIALFVAYLGGAFIPAISDWVDLLGDFLLYAAAIAAGIAITGFTIMRRGRKVRAAEAAESAAIVSKLQTAGALDGTATPDQITAALDDGPRTGDMDVRTQRPLAGPAADDRETHV